MAKIIKTPENRFDNLPDYDFESNYIEIDDGLKLHYLDEGNKDDPVVLLLHGEPSWSYLYRKMIPVLCKNNFRAIAPDLIGFGKSDKWVEKSQYTYQNHIEWIEQLITVLGLTEIHLFCQDWGGLIGLRVVSNMPNRFSSIVASNTTLPTGQGTTPDVFFKWREFSQKSPNFNIGKAINMGTVQELSDEVMAAYDAPFPSEEYKAGARIFPTLVPVEEEDPEAINNKKAWQVLKNWQKPFLTIFGDEDNIMKGAEKIFQKKIPGAQNQNHEILSAGHFIQEEKGEELAQLVSDFIKNNSTIIS